MNREWILSAKGCLDNAKRELVYAVTAFERSEGDFTKTISSIKETIGDIECGIQSLDEYIGQ